MEDTRIGSNVTGRRALQEVDTNSPVPVKFDSRGNFDHLSNGNFTQRDKDRFTRKYADELNVNTKLKQKPLSYADAVNTPSKVVQKRRTKRHGRFPTSTPVGEVGFHDGSHTRVIQKTTTARKDSSKSDEQSRTRSNVKTARAVRHAASSENIMAKAMMNFTRGMGSVRDRMSIDFGSTRADMQMPAPIGKDFGQGKLEIPLENETLIESSTGTTATTTSQLVDDMPQRNSRIPLTAEQKRVRAAEKKGRKWQAKMIKAESKSKTLVCMLAAVKQQVEKVNQKLDDKTYQLKTLRASMIERENEIEELKSKVRENKNDSDKAYNQELEAKLEATTKALELAHENASQEFSDKFEKKISSLNSSLKSSNEEKKTLQQQLSESKKRCASLDVELRDFNTQAAAMAQELTSLKTEQNNTSVVEEEMTDLKAQINSLKEEKQTAETKVNLIQESLTKSKEQYENTKCSLEETEQALIKSKEQYENTKCSLEETEQALAKSNEQHENTKLLMKDSENKSHTLFSANENLKLELKDTSSQLSNLKISVNELEKSVSIKENELSSVREEAMKKETTLSAKISDVCDRLKQEENARKDVEDKMNGMIVELSQCKNKLTQTVLELSESKQNINVMESKVNSLQSKADEAISSLAEVEAKLQDTTKNHEIAMKTLVENHSAKLAEGEAEREQLQAELSEAKGNIRVIARVRPMSSTDNTHSAANFSYLDNCGGRKMLLTEPLQKSSVGGADRCKSHSFSLNRFLPPSSTQSDVFEEVRDLVYSSVDGAKVCIFAYGQTGAGKTHTMMGAHSIETGVSNVDLGVVPRAVNLAFSRMKTRSDEHYWDYDVSVRVVEIYNEKIRCLQTQKSSPKSSKPSFKRQNSSSSVNSVGSRGNVAEEVSSTASTAVKVTRDLDGECILTNCEVRQVNSAAEALAALASAQSNRAMGSTLMNAQSSRSHTVFTMKMSAIHRKTGEKRKGTLQLIDLAGSERLAKSGSGQDSVQLKEAQNINKSLSMLGDVIAALHRKAKHIPFRNSKLTSLLQDCMGGNSKAMMVVCISPELQSIHESLCSLRFAKKVNACEVGRSKGGRCPLCNSQ